jgi:hypothetical protein
MLTLIIDDELMLPVIQTPAESAGCCDCDCGPGCPPDCC